MLSDAWKQYKAKEISDAQWNAVQRLVSDQTKNRSAFQRVAQRLWYLQDYAMTNRKNLGFVYETGYDRISGHSYEGYRYDMINAALLMLATIAAFSSLPVEYNTGMIRLLSCSPNGGLVTVHKSCSLDLPYLCCHLCDGVSAGFYLYCIPLRFSRTVRSLCSDSFPCLHLEK